MVGKVWNADEGKILALNKCLNECFRVVKFFLSFNSTLIQTVRDKAVGVLKSFNEWRKNGRANVRRNLE